MSSLSSAGLSFRRPLRYALGALALSVLFACAFVAALLLHLDAPSSRRAIAALISDGSRVDVVSIKKISLSAIEVAEITLRDRTGRPVASAYAPGFGTTPSPSPARCSAGEHPRSIISSSTA